MDGLGELYLEIDLLLARPASTDAKARKRELIHLVDARLLSAVAHSVLKVDGDAGIVIAARKGIAVQGDTLGGGDLALYIIAVEHHGVIAWTNLLPVVGEGGSQPLSRGLHVAHRGHKGYVAEVGAPRSREVHLRKSHDAVAARVVTGAPVPACLQLGGAGVHHAMRHIGPHKHVTVVARSYSGVHRIHQTLGAHCCGQQPHQSKKE